MAKPIFEPGLSSLIWPMSNEQFLAEYWQKKPLLVRGSPERLEHLQRAYRDFDLVALLKRADLDDVRVIPREQPAIAPRQNHDIGTLLTLYDAGVQLYIGTSHLDEVGPWLRALTRDIDIIGFRARGDIYATRRGGGIGLHFDANDNFTIQLQGSKTWRYSVHEHYHKPLSNFATGGPQRLPYDPTYRTVIPRKVKRDLATVTLRPGDMLYTPVGFWHGTDAPQHSLSFNMSLAPLPWSNVLLDALKPLLNRSPAWRTTATRDADACAARLAELVHIVQGLQPEDVLRTVRTRARAPGAVESSTMLRRNPLVWWHTPTPARKDEVVIELVFPDQTVRKLTVARIFLSLLGKLPSDGRTFRASSVLSRWRHDRDDGLAFLHALLVTGLLTEAPSSTR